MEFSKYFAIQSADLSSMVSRSSSAIAFVCSFNGLWSGLVIVNTPSVLGVVSFSGDELVGHVSSDVGGGDELLGDFSGDVGGDGLVGDGLASKLSSNNDLVTKEKINGLDN